MVKLSRENLGGPLTKNCLYLSNFHEQGGQFLSSAKTPVSPQRKPDPRCCPVHAGELWGCFLHGTNTASGRDRHYQELPAELDEVLPFSPLPSFSLEPGWSGRSAPIPAQQRQRSRGNHSTKSLFFFLPRLWWDKCPPSVILPWGCCPQAPSIAVGIPGPGQVSQVVLIAATDSPPKNACAHIRAGNRYGEVVKTLQQPKICLPPAKGEIKRQHLGLNPSDARASHRGDFSAERVGRVVIPDSAASRGAFGSVSP